MPSFKIEKHIAIPAKRRATTDENEFPFADMRLNDSFLVIGEKTANRARNAASQFSKTHEGWHFISRTMTSADASKHGDVEVRIFCAACPLNIPATEEETDEEGLDEEDVVSIAR